MIRPGEIYWADFEGAGPHPVVVVSRESLNRGRYVLAVFCTSAGFEKRSTLPNSVVFRAGQFGFTADCVAQCENVLSVERDRMDLATGPVDVLDDITLRDVVKAIGYVIEADCEPV